MTLEKTINILTFLFLAFITFSISVTQFTYSLALILAIILYRNDLIKKIKNEDINTPIIVFFLAALISILFYVKPVDQVKSAGKLRFFLIFLSYYFFIISTPSQSRIKKYYFTLTIFFSITLLYIIAQHYLGKEILPYRYTTFQWDGGERLYPLYGQFSSIFIVMTMPILLYAKSLNLKIKLFFTLMLLLIFMALYLSLSRTALISVTISTLAMFIFKKKKAHAAIFLIILFSISAFYLNKKDGNLLTSLSNVADPNNPRYLSNKSRIEMITDTFDIVSAHPLTGIGYNGYGYYSEERGRKHDKVFNDTLNVLATMGVIGLVPYLWLIFIFLKESYLSVTMLKIKSIKDDFLINLSFGIFLAFFCFLLNGLFEPVFFNSKALMLMLILLSLNKVIISGTAIEIKGGEA